MRVSTSTKASMLACGSCRPRIHTTSVRDGSTVSGQPPRPEEPEQPKMGLFQTPARVDSGAGVRWLIAIGLIVAATACGPNAAPITLDAQATPTPVPWKLEPTPTAGPPTLTAAPVAPAATPTGSPRFAPTVVLPPFGATATPAPLGARPI